VEAEVGSLLLKDTAFEIPPHLSYQSITTYRVPRDVQVVLLTGHMHGFGTHYTLEVADDDGKTVRTLYHQTWQPMYKLNPPVLKYPMEEPLVLRAGTRLRQVCQWYNSTDHPLRDPTEMCVGFMYYFPDQGEIVCEPETRKDVTSQGNSKPHQPPDD
jgi:hypothetical protein